MQTKLPFSLWDTKRMYFPVHGRLQVSSGAFVAFKFSINFIQEVIFFFFSHGLSFIINSLFNYIWVSKKKYEMDYWRNGFNIKCLKNVLFSFTITCPASWL